MVKLTPEELREQIAASLYEQFAGVLEGASEDVRVSLSEASDRMVRSLATGRTDLAHKVQGQFDVVLERNGVRARSAAGRMMQASLSTIARFAVRLIDQGLLEVADAIDDLADSAEDLSESSEPS